MSKNLFIAALESEVQGTVGIDAVHTQDTFQPKPGFKEGDAEPSNDDIKATKEFGEEHPIADHDEIDTVAESQEHTLALEHLQATVMRFCRVATALEEIADTAEANLAEGQAMDPATVSMVTTAVDAAGVGEPMEQAVALESFDFSPQVATEGFIDAVRERASKVWTAIAKFFKKAVEMTSEKMKRFADGFRDLVKKYDSIEKDVAALEGAAGKPFQNAKWEKEIQDRVYAPASTKTLVQAVDNAASEYEEVMKIADVKLQSDIRALNNAWATDKPESVVAAMNKVLATCKVLTEMGAARFKHSSVSMEVNLPDRISIEGTAGLQGTAVVYRAGQQEFSAGVKIASAADIKKLKESARQATRAWDSMFSELFNGGFNEAYKTRHDFDTNEESKKVANQLLTKYVNLLRIATDLFSGCVIGAADGFYSNHMAAARWARLSVAEAKAAKRDGK